MKTLKHEEVHRTEYRNLADARARIGRFLESIYNDRTDAFVVVVPVAERVRTQPRARAPRKKEAA